MPRWHPQLPECPTGTIAATTTAPRPWCFLSVKQNMEKSVMRRRLSQRHPAECGCFCWPRILVRTAYMHPHL